MKEIGKTTRPFRYDQIPYKYTVRVTNSFKGLDLIGRVSEELWMEVCDTVQGNNQEKERQKGKMVV